MAPNGTMTADYEIDLAEVQPPYFLEENRDNKCPGRDSIQAPTE
jgi:hypothetical protein